MSRLRPAALVTAVAVLVLAGCGSDGGGAPSNLSTRLVDPNGEPPLINAFDRAPDGRYLLTTNRGFFRIDPASDRVETVRGSVTAPTGSSPVGKFLELSLTARPGVLLGSGHPDDESAGLPTYLGFMRSDDDGRTWRTLSRVGQSDLHEIIEVGSRLYAFDAVNGTLLVSPDGGRTFEERFTPRGLVLSMALDPADPKRIVIATDDQVYRTTDEGLKWRPIAAGRGPRVAWPTPDTLLRTDADGTVERSRDGGDGFEPVGRIEGGEPYKLVALDAKRFAAVLADGTITESSDGGASWRIVFRP